MAYDEGYAADYLEGSWSDPEYPKGYDYKSYEAVEGPSGYGTMYNPKYDEYGVSSYMGPAVAGSSTTSSYDRYTPYSEETSTSKITSGLKSGGGGTTKPSTMGSIGYTKSVAPSTPAPVLGAMPEFTGPEWDEREVRRLTQTKAAPGVRRLRTAVQQAMATPHENPNVKALSLREALGGYGQGLQSVMTGAESAAQSEYGRRYAQEYQGKAMSYQANIQAKMAEYQAAMQNYMRQYTTQSVQKSLTQADVEANPELLDEMGLKKSSTSSTTGTRISPWGWRY